MLIHLANVLRVSEEALASLHQWELWSLYPVRNGSLWLSRDQAKSDISLNNRCVVQRLGHPVF